MVEVQAVARAAEDQAAVGAPEVVLVAVLREEEMEPMALGRPCLMLHHSRDRILGRLENRVELSRSL